MWLIKVIEDDLDPGWFSDFLFRLAEDVIVSCVHHQSWRQLTEQGAEYAKKRMLLASEAYGRALARAPGFSMKTWQEMQEIRWFSWAFMILVQRFS